LAADDNDEMSLMSVALTLTARDTKAVCQSEHDDGHDPALLH